MSRRFCHLANLATFVLAVPLVLLSPGRAWSQGLAGSEPSLENTVEAGASEVPQSKRRMVKWNQFDGPVTTLRVGGGFLYDVAAYAQDEDSKRQFALEPQGKIRDARFLLNGRFKTERKMTWCAGIMYDVPTKTWLMRQTGVMVEVPELWGNIFVGRSKEGFSLNKVMNGYTGWTQERAAMSDTIPLLADGVKWLGYVPSHRLLWNIGYFGDAFSEGQTFSSYDNQFVTRVALLPMASETTGKLLHLGVNARYGIVNDGNLRLRARPESFTAPYFVDTGKFAAHDTTMAGGEAYYRPGNWLFGTEYWFEKVDALATADPLFHGGDAVVTWLITGETRPYNTVEGIFKQISPAQSVFEGGPGAWELVLRESYVDFESKSINGGRFWRFTPMVNWYLSDELRLEMTYGYGVLDRFGLTGDTQFFQARLQIWI